MISIFTLLNSINLIFQYNLMFNFTEVFVEVICKKNDKLFSLDTMVKLYLEYIESELSREFSMMKFLRRSRYIL